MRKIQMAWRGVALLGLAGILAACGGGPIAIKGRVLDDKGTAIKGAEINTDPITDTVQTTGQGYFVLSRRISEGGDPLPLEAGSYTVQIRMLGFADAEVKVTVESGDVVLPSVTLLPKELDVGDTAPDALDEKPTDMDSSNTPTQGT
jgi:hypothetical protein